MSTLTQTHNLEIKWPNLGYEALPDEAKAVMNHLRTVSVVRPINAPLARFAKYAKATQRQVSKFI